MVCYVKVLYVIFYRVGKGIPVCSPVVFKSAGGFMGYAGAELIFDDNGEVV